MTVIPDHTIFALCQTKREEPVDRSSLRTRMVEQTPLITPFDPECVEPASYDCKLGQEFIVFDKHEGLFIDLAKVDDPSARKVTKTAEEGFILHPGEFVLGVTAERVAIPSWLVARIEGKSSIGRLGLTAHVTAGYIDPGFVGPITLEIANLRTIPIILRPGKAFCQLSFHRMSEAPTKTYDGRYQNAQGVQASRYGQDLESVRAEQIGEQIASMRTVGYTANGPITGGLLPFDPREDALRRSKPQASDPEVI